MLIGPVFLLSFMAALSIAYAANDLVHCETQCSTELQNCILRDPTSVNRLHSLDIYYPCAYSCTENSFTNAPTAVNAAVLHAAEIAKCDSHCNIELEHCLYHNASLSQQCLTVYYSCVSSCTVNPSVPQNVVTDAPTLQSTHLQHLFTQKSPQTQPTTTLRPSSTFTSTIKPVITDAPSTTSYPPSVASTAKTTAPHHASGRSTILTWVTLPRRVNKH